MFQWVKDVFRRGIGRGVDSATQRDMVANREMAWRLLNGYGADKDEEKAVSLLEDCVARCDVDAMVMLAKCCALGRGIEHDAKRAEALLSDAAKKGNDEARFLMKLINEWKGKESIDLGCLKECFLKEQKRENLCLRCFLQGASRNNAR